MVMFGALGLFSLVLLLSMYGLRVLKHYLHH